MAEIERPRLMRRRSVQRHIEFVRVADVDLMFGILSSKQPKQGRVNEKIQQRRANQPAENHRGHRVKNFFSRLSGCHHQRNQSDPRGQRRH